MHKNKGERWLTTKHNKTFAKWLKNKVKTSYYEEGMDEVVVQLGNGLQHLVATYQGYNINGYTFYTMEFSGADHEARCRIAKDSYYGVIQEIWELKYDSIIVPLFKCRWVDNQQGVKVDNYGFTIFDLSTNGYVSEPFILAKQATQVFFYRGSKGFGMEHRLAW